VCIFFAAHAWRVSGLSEFNSCLAYLGMISMVARRVGMRMMHPKLFLGKAADQTLFAASFFHTRIPISRVDVVDDQVS
jgi:hypothetical protein